MRRNLFFPVGVTNSCRYAVSYLKQAGCRITDHPTPEITHLLLDIPSFGSDGMLQNGFDPKELLRMLPPDVKIIGGNLDLDFLSGYPRIDLLQDNIFLAKNAAITADCALRVSTQYMDTTFADSSALILGWGRIGKNLGRMLQSTGCSVSIAARNPKDRALLETFGFHAIDFSDVPDILPSLTILYNTIPVQTLDRSLLDSWTAGIKIDLASLPGMTAENVIPARGLPGKYAPESAGKLIAQTILRLI